MCYLFDDFKGWKVYCEEKEMELFEAVVEYEVTQKQRTQETIWNGLQAAYQVMKQAVKTGLTEEMISRSGMINDGAKKVYNHNQTVLSKEFQVLISRPLLPKK